MKVEKFFLTRLYKRSKLLFWFAIAFIIGQAFFTYKTVETVPFFNYGMYSAVYPKAVDHEVIAIYLDTIRIDKHVKSRFPFDFIIETFDYYRQLDDRGFSDTILVTINKRFKNRVSEESLSRIIEMLANDTVDKAAYEEWAFNFIRSFYNEDAQRLRVEIEKYKFVDNRLAFINKRLLFEYERGA